MPIAARLVVATLAALSISACDTTPVARNPVPKQTKPEKQKTGAALVPLEYYEPVDGDRIPKLPQSEGHISDAQLIPAHDYEPAAEERARKQAEVREQVSSAQLIFPQDYAGVVGERNGKPVGAGAQIGAGEQIPDAQLIGPEHFQTARALNGPQAPKDPIEAIEAALREGQRSAPPRRQAAYLEAAYGLVEIQHLNDAEWILRHVDVTGLAPALALRKRLIRAAIAFRRGGALDHIMELVKSALASQAIGPTYLSRGLDLEARIDLRQDLALEAAKAWIRQRKYLTDAQRVTGNNQRIWYALGQLNGLRLQLASQGSTGVALRGWLDLSILVMEFGGQRDALRTAIEQWVDANPSHPAAGFAKHLLGPPRAAGIHQIALLLPMSSNYRVAAQRVYNGFYAANRLDHDSRRPQVVLYDVGADSALAGNYLTAALAGGADAIVGPLGKAAVNALLDARRPDTPMLLLGTASAPRSLTTGTYQFDLAPGLEAEEVAAFMYVSGHRRVAALYPADEWGQRVYRAFVDQFRSLGGTIAEGLAYDPEAGDFTKTLKDLFNLGESEHRHALLEATIGVNLRFDPRRRRDIDAIFLAARPWEARLLNPQIDFFQGHELPVYSTSRVYTGTPDPIKDTDLDGIRFPDMPWRLIHSARFEHLHAVFSDSGYDQAASELFAFGFDAYQLALLISNPNLAGAAKLFGLTGGLLLGDDNRVHRRLDWARFEDGVPVTIWGN